MTAVWRGTVRKMAVGLKHAREGVKEDTGRDEKHLLVFGLAALLAQTDEAHGYEREGVDRGHVVERGLRGRWAASGL